MSSFRYYMFNWYASSWKNFLLKELNPYYFSLRDETLFFTKNHNLILKKIFIEQNSVHLYKNGAYLKKIAVEEFLFHIYEIPFLYSTRSLFYMYITDRWLNMWLNNYRFCVWITSTWPNYLMLGARSPVYQEVMGFFSSCSSLCWQKSLSCFTKCKHIKKMTKSNNFIPLT